MISNLLAATLSVLALLPVPTATMPEPAPVLLEVTKLPSIHGNLVFLYYKDLPAARRFYGETLGLPCVLDYGFAAIFRASDSSFIGLVDEQRGMHKAAEPKTVTVAFITEQVDGWHDYLKASGVTIRNPLKSSTNHPTRGFVALDPGGYFLEFETFLEHPQNEHLRASLASVSPLAGQSGGESKRPAPLAIHGTVFWLYYQDVPAAQRFYEDTMGLRLLVDQGYAKVYTGSRSGFIGLVDGAKGLHQATPTKAVNVVFQSPGLDTWFERMKSRDVRIHSPLGPEEGGLVRAFVALDPAGYFLEFHWFTPDAKNDAILKVLNR